jgi:phosphoribosylaminoimidazole carboxylase PurE protein
MAVTKKMLVGLLLGSDSDWPVMKKCAETLNSFGVTYEVNISSAHRTPEATLSYAKSAQRRGLKAVICAAGGAAHLAGSVAAHTTLPVIGVPLAATALNGADALFSTVQMPPGVPVATVAIGEFGAINAAVLAVQILALSDANLSRKLSAYKKDLSLKVAAKNLALQKKLREEQAATRF